MAPVNTPDEFVAEEQTRVRGYFRRTGFPHLGDAPFAPAPFNLSATPAVLRRAGAGARSGRRRASRSARDSRSQSSGVRNPPLQRTDAPLAGMRVIDLGVGAVGPEVCWLLGELGAEVIKIESRANLDFLRA